MIFTNLLLILTLIFWASAFVGIRYVVQTVDPLDAAFLRYVCASLIMVLIYYYQPNKKWPKLKDWPLILASGLFGFAIYNICLNYGEQTVAAVTAGFITSQGPLVAIIFAIILLGEKLSMQKCLGLLISFSGVAILAYAEREGMNFDYGIIYILVTTFCAAIYLILQKKLVVKYHAIELTAFGIWFGTIILSFFAPHAIKQIPLLSLKSLAVIIYLGIVPGALAYSMWSYVLKKISATSAAASFYSSPFIIMILGMIFLHEIPKTLVLIGGCLALSGAVLVNFNISFYRGVGKRS